MEERGVKVDHATLNRRVIRYSSSLALAAKKRKRTVATSWDCKAFHSAKATIDGVETAPMIRKGPLSEENIPAYKQFMALAE